MKTRLRKSFGLDRYDEPEAKKCPGEDACGKFAIARSESGNGLDACANCELLPSKLKRAEEKKTDEKLDSFFGKVFDARARGRLTGAIDGSRITNLEFEMAVVAEGLVEKFEQEASGRARLSQEENSKLIVQMMKALGGFR